MLLQNFLGGIEAAHVDAVELLEEARVPGLGLAGPARAEEGVGSGPGGLCIFEDGGQGSGILEREAREEGGEAGETRSHTRARARALKSDRRR